MVHLTKKHAIPTAKLHKERIQDMIIERKSPIGKNIFIITKSIGTIQTVSQYIVVIRADIFKS